MSLLKAATLADLMTFVMSAHDLNAREEKMRFRRWDGVTPYGVHPIWCAMTILQESLLPQDTRVIGAHVLLLHDILEDTTAEIPAGTPPTVRSLVDHMTFANSEDEMARVWEKTPMVRMLKLYDKTSNLADGRGIREEKRARYVTYTRRLADDAETNFGALNVVAMARAVCDLRQSEL